MKLTPAQGRVFDKVAAGQSVSNRTDWHVACRLEDRGLIGNARCSVSFQMTFTYYELTPAGEALKAERAQ